MALVAPAIARARSSARRLQCMNRLKNVSLAMLAHETTNQRFPASGNFSATGPERFHNWVLDLLPYLDRRDLYDRYLRDQPHDVDVNQQITNTHIRALICPDDITAVPGQGNLSYVVNSGFGWTIPVDCPVSLHTTPGQSSVVAPFDFNGDGIVCPFVPTTAAESDEQLFKRTALFFVENWPSGSGTVRHHRIDSVTDGASHTMMITENVRVGYDPNTGDNWGAVEARRNSFFVSSYVCENGECSPGNVNLDHANNHSTAPYSHECINSSLTLAEGGAPWPSSYHDGQINVAFCDGHVRSVSDNIDGRVYVALVTPQGAQIQGGLREDLISDNDF